MITDAAGIWLLIGVPVTEEQLVERLSRPDSALTNDFCLEFAPPALADRSPDDIRKWISGRFSTTYEPAAADALSRLAQAARSSGIQVVEAATLEDLGCASAIARVIVIASHWKAHEYVANDFLPAFATKAEARLTKATPLAHWLQQQTAKPAWHQLLFRSQRTLRYVLNDLPLADCNDDRRCEGVDCYIELPSTRAARRRAEADALFEGLVRQGNRLELFDGLHSREQVADRLRHFAGVVDLTTCTSTWLGDHITHTSGQRIRTVQFPTPQEFNDAGARLAAVFDLASRGWDYLEARLEVEALFEDTLKTFYDGGVV